MNDAKALSKIQNGVSSSIFPGIIGATTAKEAWETLQQEFQGDRKVITCKLQSLRREFENLKMKDSESMKDFSSKVVDNVNQMKTYGEKITDHTIVEKVLISLPEKYDDIVAIIVETKDLGTLSVQQLMGSLQSHEQRKLRHDNPSFESAFQSKLAFSSQQKFSRSSEFQKEPRQDGFKLRKHLTNREEDGQSQKGMTLNYSKPVCKICKRNNHTTSNCRFRGKPQCYNCKRFGHVEKNCKVKRDDQANFSEEKDCEGNLFFTSQTDTKESKNTWYLDSACSNHMSGNEKMFLDMDTTVMPKVRLGDGSLVEARGKGSISLGTQNGIEFIHDVLYVPNLEQNLPSVRQLIENGYHLYFANRCCKIYDRKDRNQVIAIVEMEEKRNFSIEFQCGTLAACKAKVMGESWLWHKRFCHLHFNALKMLQEKCMVKGLPAIDTISNPCEGCIMGKQHRLPFLKISSWRAKSPLELVHTDLCGRMKTPSFSEKMHFLLFVDDYSRMTWVYFLKEKSETFRVFKSFKALVEKQSGCYIKRIKSDRR
ncbi:hypothetical protein RJ640_000365 [Escallonia rubra]|uniref:Retrovirus-related Pol polyprotein from transposon TNT 1-94 n=1 Tax=Escallonia rubra TaxID=112253 RepID=A0AA88QUT9_9ASTE|nr:hypothetical protein RJ640_000365 [Escallonia rubra]